MPGATWRLSGDRLVVPDQLAVVPIAGRAGRGRGAAGGRRRRRAVWLRPRSRRLVRRPLAGHQGVVGWAAARRSGAGPADAGRPQPFLGAHPAAASTATPPRPSSSSRPRRCPGRGSPTPTGDGADGVWLTEVGPRARGGCGTSTAGAAPASRRSPSRSTGGGERRRRHRRPARRRRSRGVGDRPRRRPGGRRPVTHRARPRATRQGHTLLTATADGRFHLLTVVVRRPRRLRGGGASRHVEDHQELDCRRVGRPTALVGGARRRSSPPARAAWARSQRARRDRRPHVDVRHPGAGLPGGSAVGLGPGRDRRCAARRHRDGRHVGRDRRRVDSPPAPRASRRPGDRGPRATSWTRCCRGATTRPRPTAGSPDAGEAERWPRCSTRAAAATLWLPGAAAHPAGSRPARARRPARALPRHLLPRPPARRLPGAPPGRARSCGASWPPTSCCSTASTPSWPHCPTASTRPPRTRPAPTTCWAGWDSRRWATCPPGSGRRCWRGRAELLDLRGTHAGSAAAAGPSDRRSSHRGRQRRRAGRLVPRTDGSARRSARRPRAWASTRCPRPAALARPGRDDGRRRDPARSRLPGPGARAGARPATSPSPSRPTRSGDGVAAADARTADTRVRPRPLPAAARLHRQQTPTDRSRRLDVDFRLGPDASARLHGAGTGGWAPRPPPAVDAARSAVPPGRTRPRRPPGRPHRLH